MVKRCVDVCLALPALLILTPILLLLAFALAVDLRAVPFFVQKRIGAGGRELGFLKLRTLPPSTPKYALKHDLGDVHLTPLRAFLRRMHLDELPQLVHVVTGKLSLVGPRPRMPDNHEPVDPHYARMRIRVPQGCTGLWQIGAHKDLLPSESPQYDLFYVQHASVALDLWILYRTGLQFLGVGRPVSLADVPAFLLRRSPDAAEATIDLTAIDLNPAAFSDIAA